MLLSLDALIAAGVSMLLLSRTSGHLATVIGLALLLLRAGGELKQLRRRRGCWATSRRLARSRATARYRFNGAASTLGRGPSEAEWVEDAFAVAITR